MVYNVYGYYRISIIAVAIAMGPAAVNLEPVQVMTNVSIRNAFGVSDQESLINFRSENLVTQQLVISETISDSGTFDQILQSLALMEADCSQQAHSAISAASTECDSYAPRTKKRTRTSGSGATNVPEEVVIDRSHSVRRRTSNSARSEPVQLPERPIHRISWQPFTRAGAFSRGVFDRTRNAVLQAMFTELRRQSKRPMSAIVQSVVKNIMTRESPAMQEIWAADGRLS